MIVQDPVLFDYLKGVDFAQSDGLIMKTDMRLLTQEKVSEYSILLDSACP